MSIKILQLQKRASYEYKYIQDRYAQSSDNNTFALADGTTQSFNSELWAEIITDNFVKNPSFDPLNLISKFKECIPSYKNTTFEFSTNPAKASLERTKQNKGGTATFIGLQINKGNNIDIISCGDTNLFLLNSENKIKTFPFSTIDSLDANNHFINTEVLLRNGIDDTFFKKTSLSYNHNDIIIVATDALSRLILKKPTIISDILNIQSFEQLHDFSVKNWENKELEEDDISALIIPIGKTDKTQLICPPNNFQFPREKEKEFIPTSISQDIIKEGKTIEVKKIRAELNVLSKDMYVVKSKLKLHKSLYTVTISLLMVIIIMMYLFRSKTHINRPNISTTEIENKNVKTKEVLKSENIEIINEISDSTDQIEDKKQIKEKENALISN